MNSTTWDIVLIECPCKRRSRFFDTIKSKVLDVVDSHHEFILWEKLPEQRF